LITPIPEELYKVPSTTLTAVAPLTENLMVYRYQDLIIAQIDNTLVQGPLAPQSHHWLIGKVSTDNDQIIGRFVGWGVNNHGTFIMRKYQSKYNSLVKDNQGQIVTLDESPIRMFIMLKFAVSKLKTFVVSDPMNLLGMGDVLSVPKSLLATAYEARF
jgi:hypothetical protein